MKRLYPTIEELSFYQKIARENKISGISIAMMDKEDLKKRFRNHCQSMSNKSEKISISQPTK